MKNIAIYQERMIPSISWMDLHYSEEIDFDTVAAQSFFSRFHFHRIFKALIGETPAEYLRRIRLENAMHKIIVKSEKSLTEIALDHGFSSQSLFTRVFQQHFGHSPRWFQKKGHLLTGSNRFVESLALGKNVVPMIQHLPSKRIAFIRSKGYFEEAIRLAFEKLFSYAGKAGMLKQRPEVIGIGLDHPNVTDVMNCRYLAAITIPPDVEVTAPLTEMIIPKGLTAIHTYKGPESGIQNAYQELYDGWLVNSSYVPSDFPLYQFIRRTPTTHGGLDFELDICMQITK